MPPRLVITFFPSSKRLLISWLQSPSAVILEPKRRKSVTVSIISPSICHEVMGPAAMILVFWMLSFKPAFSFFSFTFIKKIFSSTVLFAFCHEWCHLHIWDYWYFSLQSWFQRGLHPVWHFSWCSRASLIAQLVKNPPALQETLVQFLGWEDSLEKGLATHFTILGLPLWLSW